MTLGSVNDGKILLFHIKTAKTPVTLGVHVPLLPVLHDSTRKVMPCNPNAQAIFAKRTKFAGSNLSVLFDLKNK